MVAFSTKLLEAVMFALFCVMYCSLKIDIPVPPFMIESDWSWEIVPGKELTILLNSTYRRCRSGFPP